MLEVGNVVQLNSGSPNMTVTRELNEHWVATTWFLDGKTLKGEFRKDNLTKQ